MEEKEALEMLKSLRFNWTIDLNKIPDMCEWIEQQLQSYKQKEDKLRDIFEDERLKELNKYYYGDSYELDVHELRKDILQILNEGGKINE